jgi:hypothetical protein
MSNSSAIAKALIAATLQIYLTIPPWNLDFYQFLHGRVIIGLPAR